eukprot:3941930-Rhodomonas_salina.17
MSNRALAMSNRAPGNARRDIYQNGGRHAHHEHHASSSEAIRFGKALTDLQTAAPDSSMHWVSTRHHPTYATSVWHLA